MPEHNHAAALANWIEGEECGVAGDGIHLGPTDLMLIAKALRVLAAASQELKLTQTSVNLQI